MFQKDQIVDWHWCGQLHETFRRFLQSKKGTQEKEIVDEKSKSLLLRAPSLLLFESSLEMTVMRNNNEKYEEVRVVRSRAGARRVRGE